MLTPEKRKEAIDMFRQGLPHMAIAEKLGVSHQTLRNEADRDPEFLEAEKEMYLQWEHRIEWAQVRAAVGQLVVEPGKVFNETAAIFMLKHLNRARYGDALPETLGAMSIKQLFDAVKDE